MGDEKSTAPSKGKGSNSQTGGGRKQNSANKRATKSKASDEDKNDGANGTGSSTTQPAMTTPKKRAHESRPDSDMDEDSPSKVMKTEVKDENDDDG
jgi:hypothetical protein